MDCTLDHQGELKFSCPVMVLGRGRHSNSSWHGCRWWGKAILYLRENFLHHSSLLKMLWSKAFLVWSSFPPWLPHSKHTCMAGDWHSQHKVEGQEGFSKAKPGLTKRKTTPVWATRNIDQPLIFLFLPVYNFSITYHSKVHPSLAKCSINDLEQDACSSHLISYHQRGRWEVSGGLLLLLLKCSLVNSPRSMPSWCLTTIENKDGEEYILML